MSESEVGNQPQPTSQSTRPGDEETLKNSIQDQESNDDETMLTIFRRPDFDLDDGDVIWHEEAETLRQRRKVFKVRIQEEDSDDEDMRLMVKTISSKDCTFDMRKDLHIVKPEGDIKDKSLILCACCNPNLTEEELRSLTMFRHREFQVRIWQGPGSRPFPLYPFPAHLDPHFLFDHDYEINNADASALEDRQLPLNVQDAVLQYIKTKEEKELDDKLSFTRSNYIDSLEMSVLYKKYHSQFPGSVYFPPPTEMLLPGNKTGRPPFYDAIKKTDVFKSKKITPRPTHYFGVQKPINEGDPLAFETEKQVKEFYEKIARSWEQKDNRATLCHMCSLIRFESLFQKMEIPRIWRVRPAANLMNQDTACAFCSILRGAVLQHKIPVQEDNSYVPVALIPDQLFQGFYGHNPYKTSLTIMPEMACDVPMIQTHLVSENYTSGHPLKARIPSRHVIDVSLIRYWLRFCETHHQNQCGSLPWSRGESPPSAFRVIDVHSYSLVSAPPHCRYCALSYVWGGSQVFRTLKSNISSVSELGGVRRVQEQLPKTVVDALRLVEAIGEKYLWVDAICIVQDDEAEVSNQIYHMDSIYAQATITIVAAGGSDASAGLPGIWPHLRLLPQVVEEVDQGTRLALPLEPSRKLNDSTWNSRAWTFQEKLLSPRTLIFIDDQVFWRCRGSTWFEDIISEVEETALGYPVAIMKDGRDADVAESVNMNDIPRIKSKRGGSLYPLKMPTCGAPYEPASLDASSYERLDSENQGRISFFIRNRIQNRDPVAYTLGKEYKVEKAKYDYHNPFSPDPKLRDVLFSHSGQDYRLLSWNFRQYSNVVTEYSKRKISFEADILRAFTGLQRTFEACLSVTFMWGLPASHFDAALLWMPEGNLERRDLGPIETPPSWSWMGWRGKICYSIQHGNEEREWEIKARPVVRWRVSDLQETHLLNGTGIGMTSGQMELGRLVEEWKDERWDRDCLYTNLEYIADPTNLDSNNKHNIFRGVSGYGPQYLYFQTLSAYFIIEFAPTRLPHRGWGSPESTRPSSSSSSSASSSSSLFSSAPDELADEDDLFSNSLRPNVPCHRILSSTRRPVGFIAFNISNTTIDFTRKVELVVIAVSLGKGFEYSGYAVMAVRRREGTGECEVQERIGAGEIEKDAWWAGDPQWKHITLG